MKHDSLVLFCYYLAQVYVPSTLLVIVSWVSFWLDRNAVPARVTLGVTTLLTMTTQAASINNSLPAVSYIKAVDVWIGVCLAFIFATVLEYAFVSYEASMYKTEDHSCHVADAALDSKKPVSCDQAEPSSPRKDSWGAEKHEEQKLLRSAALRSTSVFGFHWWQRWKAGADPPKMIDLRSRLIFPALFVIFNIIYWTWYSAL
ncbi:Neurotransmitter-gated ion-channel transmembrane region [Ancylostoma caninum]|uniref:Neurotransmitter-gated ion-channel transmembrane region n=1 Tax=Ancylostoma caninum TaxID=29170 RepID=A0A368FG35_ANCCA|nr:Neurotransmitter-gated ion-channel transmembrane region [Ancylostoma caninum]